MSLIASQSLPRPALPPCRHCGSGKLRANHPRGLCYRCWQDRTVRVRYPCAERQTPPARLAHGQTPAPREPRPSGQPCLWCQRKWRAGPLVLCERCRKWIEEARASLPAGDYP